MLTSLVTLLRVRSRNRVASRYWVQVPGRSWRWGASTVDEPRWQLPRDAPAGISAAQSHLPAGRDSRLANLDALGAPMHVTGQAKHCFHIIKASQSATGSHLFRLLQLTRFKRTWSGCVTFSACCRSIEPKESFRPWSRCIRKRLFKLDTRRPCTILNLTPAHLLPNTTTPSPGPCKTPNKQRQNTRIRFLSVRSPPTPATHHELHR